MNRQQKDGVIKDLSQKFSDNAAAFVVRCEGMTVADLHRLRLNLEKKDGQLKVAKNRLVKLALGDHAEAQVLTASLRGQTAIVFAKSEFTAVAKVLHDFARKNETLEIVAGCCEAQLFDKAGVARLATIPSREVLLARLCGVLQAPMAQVAYIVSQVAAQKSGTTAQE